MRQPTIHDLLSASYSCIYIETRDFEGAESMVKDAVASLNESGHRMIPVDREGGTEKEPVRTQFGVWTITEGTSLYELNSILDGARIPNPAPEKQTASLPQALNLIKASQDSIVMVYHNPRTLVSSNPAHNQNVQLIVEASMAARQKFSCLVFIGQAWEIPPELDSLVYRFDWPLPSQEQLVEICLDKVILPNLDNTSFLNKPGKKERPEAGESRSIFRKRKLYELNKEMFDEVARAASGLDPLNAENAFALSLTMNDALDPKIIQEQKRQIIKKSGALEFFSTEETMNDVGGFGRYKAWIARRKGAFTREAEVAGVPYPKGVLHVGVPGSGKSLAAKATANGLGLPLVRFDISKVKGSLVGESEGNMRRNLQVAEAIAPCVLWVDELEKALAGWKTGNDSGVAKSITGQFLQWRQETKAPIFICCTCNDVESIPPEFYRPGRIDAIFATSLPNLQERMEIFKIHLRKKKQKPKRFEIKQLAMAAKKFTGAEIELTITEAIFEMFASKTKLTTEMIYEAIKQIVPQSKRSSADLKAVEAWAAERAIPVSDAIPHGHESTNRPQGRVISKSEG
jgi:AAA+ superfamily predicted ATPase